MSLSKKAKQEKLEKECLEWAEGILEQVAYLDAAKKLIVNLTGEDYELVMCAVEEAKNHLGSPHRSKAVVHMATEYLKYGPKNRAMESIKLKTAIREEALERQMQELGAETVMEVFAKAFSEKA